MLFEQLIKKVNSGSFSRFVAIIVMAGLGVCLSVLDIAIVSYLPERLGKYNHAMQLWFMFIIFLTSFSQVFYLSAALSFYISFFQEINYKIVGIIFMLFSLVVLIAITNEIASFVEPNIEKQQAGFRAIVWIYISGAIIIFIRLILTGSKNMLTEYLICIMLLSISKMIYSISFSIVFGIVNGNLKVIFNYCIVKAIENKSMCQEEIWYLFMIYIRNFAFYIIYCGVALVFMRYFYDQIKKQSI